MIYIAMPGFPILLWMQMDARFCTPMPIEAISLAAARGRGGVLPERLPSRLHYRSGYWKPSFQELCAVMCTLDRKAPASFVSTGHSISVTAHRGCSGEETIAENIPGNYFCTPRLLLYDRRAYILR